MLSGNIVSFVIALNDLFDLENDFKVTHFRLGPCLVLVLLCTELVRIRQIFLEITSGNPFPYVFVLSDLFDLENDAKVTRFKLAFCLALMLVYHIQ